MNHYDQDHSLGSTGRLTCPQGSYYPIEEESVGVSEVGIVCLKKSHDEGEFVDSWGGSVKGCKKGMKRPHVEG